MKVLITGARGLIGTSLARALVAAGHEVVLAVRRLSGTAGTERSSEVLWDAMAGFPDPASLPAIDAAVHLAGENIVGPWSDEKKRAIFDSRVRGVRNLLETFGRLPSPPATLLCASASGYYGDCGDRAVDESAPAGAMFLSEVAAAVEREASAGRERNIRVVLPRLAMVLSAEGGALAKMLPAFRAGAGGPIAGGQQYWSWIDIDDAAAALVFLLTRGDLCGPFNVASPDPVPQARFAHALGAALHRPAVMPLPAFALKLAMGPMAQEVLLPSIRLDTRRLADSGFTWKYPHLDESLSHLLTPGRG